MRKFAVSFCMMALLVVTGCGQVPVVVPPVSERLSSISILAYGIPSERDGGKHIAGNPIIKTPDGKCKMLYYGYSEEDQLSRFGLAESVTFFAEKSIIPHHGGF